MTIDHLSNQIWNLDNSMAVDEDRVSVSHLRCWVGTGWIANAMGCLHVSSKGVIPPKQLATLVTGKVLHP